MNQINIDFSAAQNARDSAIKIAIDHADRVVPNWSEQAFHFLAAYLPKVETLTSEDVRDACINIVPAPPSLRAWGGVFMRAAKAGLITRHGYATARDPKVHCNVVTLWKSNKFNGARSSE